MMFKSTFDLETCLFEYEWEIKHIPLLVEYSKKQIITIKTDSFFFGDDDSIKWHIECEISQYHPPTHHVKFKFYVVCDASGRDGDGFWLTTEAYEISSEKGIALEKYNQLHTIGADQTFWRMFAGNYKIDRSGCNPLNIKQLKFIWKFKRMNEIKFRTKRSRVPKILGANPAIYLTDLLISEKFSDVTFILGNEKLRAHKNILATRSPVFAAMFEHPMKEQIENEVIIVDVNVDTFKEMLLFIYTNEVLNLKKMATELLYVADKYELNELKELCGQSIYREITVENAIEAFIFVNRHNVKSASEAIGNFIKRHIYAVIKTTSYKTLEKEHPERVCLLFRELFKASR